MGNHQQSTAELDAEARYHDEIEAVFGFYKGMLERHAYTPKYSNTLNLMLSSLYLQQQAEEMKRRFSGRGAELVDEKLARAHFFCVLANVSYANELSEAGVPNRSVLKMCLGNRDVYRTPPEVVRHVVVREHLATQGGVVVIIRGTADLSDILSDTKATERSFYEGWAHSGLLAEAQVFCEELVPLLEKHVENKLTLVGHSLGAGVAVLSAILLRREYLPESVGIECFTYGCPGIVSGEFDEKTLTNLTFLNFVNNDDVVPRSCLYNLERSIRLWIALDSLEAFTYSERLWSLTQMRIPKRVCSLLDKILSKQDTTLEASRHLPLYVPGQCVWLVPKTNQEQEQGEKHVIPPTGNTFFPQNNEVYMHRMFTGTTWLVDHSLAKYKQALESS